MTQVRVLVAATEGSAPREAGAVMLVGADSFEGTIGGGTLEHEALAAARTLLADPSAGLWHRELRSYPLGPSLGQCCGGVVRLLLEVVPCPRGGERLLPWGEGGAKRRMRGAPDAGPSSPHRELHTPHPPFGHLLFKGEGDAADPRGLVVRPVTSGTPPILVTGRKEAADLPLHVLRVVRQMLSGARPRQTTLLPGRKGGPDWVIEPSERSLHHLHLYGAGHVGRAVVRVMEGLPFTITWIDTAADRFPAPLPSQVKAVVTDDPAGYAARAPAGTLHLIMTYSHQIDLAICHAVLARDFAWAGLIGSASKRARFERQLRDAGIGKAALGRLVCPIGLGGITGKEPAVIAVSVAAQLALWASEHAAGAQPRQESAHAG